MKGARYCLVAVLWLSLWMAGASGTDYPITITDSAGRDVTIPMPVERIIVLNSDAAEAVEILGASDRIVGVVDTIKKSGWYYPELEDCEVVGTWSEFDFEKIAEIALSGGDSIVPNMLVICYPSGTSGGKSYGVDAVEAGLAPFGGIAVVSLNLYKDQTIEGEMEILGEILGRDGEAQAFLDWRQEKREEVLDAVSGEPDPLVYFERTQPKGIGELKTNGASAEINDLISDAGGENIFGDISEESYTTDWESVISRSPEVILQASTAENLGWESGVSLQSIDLSKIRDEILDRPGAAAVPAIDQDRVWIIYRNILYGLDSVVGMTCMAKLFHPEADLDPDGVYQEYLEMKGLTFSGDRTLVYPQMGA